MKAKILEKKVLADLWGDYSRYEIEYTRSDGRVEIQKREILDTGNGAAVLLYNQDKREIMLLRQFRLASMINESHNGVIIEVCAGLIEKNDPEYTIKKEIKEETGLIIEEVFFHYKGYATPGAKTEMIYFFSAEYNDQTPRVNGGGLLSEQEDIEVFTIDFDEAYSMIYSGEIIDLKTISLLQFAKINLFKNT
jgi:GDP-mannose pyrophosphatase NudK